MGIERSKKQRGKVIELAYESVIEHSYFYVRFLFLFALEFQNSESGIANATISKRLQEVCHLSSVFYKCWKTSPLGSHAERRNVARLVRNSSLEISLAHKLLSASSLWIALPNTEWANFFTSLRNEKRPFFLSFSTHL